MNAAELSTRSTVIEITSRAPVTSEAPAHASSTTSSAVTSPRADDVIAQLRNHEVGLYNGDVNIPSDSYFTGDEEIPIWNAVGHVPLLDATTTTTTTTMRLITGPGQCHRLKSGLPRPGQVPGRGGTFEVATVAVVNCLLLLFTFCC